MAIAMNPVKILHSHIYTHKEREERTKPSKRVKYLRGPVWGFVSVCGVCVRGGLLCFVFCEKVKSETERASEEP